MTFLNTNSIVHHYDRGGALHSNHYVRTVQRGKHKGAVLVKDHNGRVFKPFRIRNIEEKS